MNVIIINTFFAIVAILALIFSPEGYSYYFCLFVAIAFLLHSILYFRFKPDKDIVCFELFFIISFAFVNFIYPIFYYPTTPHVATFVIPFNVNIISKSTAIAYLAFTFFMLGITNKVNVNKYALIQKKSEFRFNKNIFHIYFLITIVCFGLFLFFGGLEALRDVYSGHGDLRKVGTYSYYYNLFTISCLILAIFIFKLKKNEYLFYAIVLLFFILAILTTGSRITIIAIALVMIFGYNMHVNKINRFTVLTMLAVGSLTLFVLVYLRQHNINDGKWIMAFSKIKFNSFLDIFMDLTCNNRNLYVLVDYADIHSYTYFKGMLVDILSPIPGMTNYLTKLLNEPIEIFTGGALPTYLALGKNSSYGLGTNMVGEAFVTFGYGGVTLGFYLIGHIIKYTRQNAYRSVYMYVIYYVFVSHAIFYPRAPFIINLRTIVWSLLLVYAVNSITIFREKKQKVEAEKLIENK